MRVTRIDVGNRIRADLRTPQGGAKIPANLTRTGVFVYHRDDGTVQRELRLPEEVFHDDAMRSIDTAAVTVGHPGKVTPDNWRTLSVGHPSNPRRDGIFAAADLVINDATTLRRIDAGELVEISMGYDCEVELRSGVYDGQPYDAIQRNIRYNHIGLLPEGAGRAGSAVRLRLDGVDCGVAYTPGMPEQDNDLKTRLDAMTADFTAVRAERDRLQGRLDAAEGRVTALTRENTELKQQLAGAQDVKRIDARIKDRMALVDGVRLLVGKAEVPLSREDGAVKTDRDLMIEGIVARVPDFKADGKSDDYVRARFDAEVDTLRKSGASLANLNVASRPTADANSDELAAAQEKFRKDSAGEFDKAMNGTAPAAG